MAGKFVMLQKKLQELESELADVIRLQIAPTAAEQTPPFDDIRERIEFLEKIRAAEADSQQTQNSDDELRDIDRRIALLKAAFSDWNKPRNCGFNDGDDDTQSICSDCTQNQGLLRESGSPRREVEDFSGRRLLEDQNEAAAEAKADTATEAESETETEEEEEEAAVAAGRNWREIGKYCGVFGCGMIVGGVCMVLNLSFPYYLIFREETFLIPPT